MLAAMTGEQIALYGGSLIIGPLLAGVLVLFYLWHQHGPLTKRGREKMRLQRERSQAYFLQRAKEREEAMSPPAPEDEQPVETIWVRLPRSK